LIAFNLSFFLTGIARLDVKNDLKIWIFKLLLAAFSFLALISADLWSVVLLWTVLDLLELAFHYIILKEVNGKNFYRKFIIKSFGTILLIWNIAFLSKSGFNPLLSGIIASTPTTSIFFAALMHSGIFPLNRESKRSAEEKSTELLKTVFSVSSFVVSFSLITSLPVPVISFAISSVFYFLSFLMIIFSLIQWILRKELKESLQFLLLGEAGGFIFLYFSGATQYITYALALLLLSVLWLVIFTHRSKTLLIFPLISTFYITGLPLSLVTFGTRGFIGNGISIGSVVLIIMQILFIFGYQKYAFEKNEKFNELEGWYQAAYLAGLFILFLSAAAIIFFSKTSLSSEINYWWMGVFVVIPGFFGNLFSGKKIIKVKAPIFLSQEKQASILEFLSFQWFFNFVTFIENKGRGLINEFSGLMEGEGGILWALVFLVLIFSVLI
jgi:hypothetical protein